MLKNNSTVFWTPYYNNQSGTNVDKRMQSIQILYKEPIPFYSYLSSKRNSEYMKCPALIDFCRNTYVITAPFDFSISFDMKNQKVYSSISQQYYDNLIIPRGHDTTEIDPLLITLPPVYVFYSHQNIVMESMSLFILNNDSIDNVNLIPGKFNIQKWIRPIDFTIEIKDTNKDVKIKEGDPLFCIRFTDIENNSKINLERTEFTEKLQDIIFSCVHIKDISPNLSLKRCYELSKKYLNFLRSKKLI
jgi:hypothetical protein